MVKLNLSSSVVAVALVCLSTGYVAHATPFLHGGQTPFHLSESSTHRDNPGSGGRPAAIEYALKALTEASAQVLETFETVMAELGDVAKDMTWSLPKKNITPRPHGWDYTVSSAALPDHALRVKKPNSLGVDHVKQVCIHIGVQSLTRTVLWLSRRQ
jgi:hypothetical protein